MSDKAEALFIIGLLVIVIGFSCAIAVRSVAKDRAVCLDALAGSTTASDTLRVVIANSDCVGHLTRKVER